MLADLCDKECFARKFAWLGKRNAKIAPVAPKVRARHARNPLSRFACLPRSLRAVAGGPCSLSRGPADRREDVCSSPGSGRPGCGGLRPARCLGVENESSARCAT